MSIRDGAEQHNLWVREKCWSASEDCSEDDVFALHLVSGGGGGSAGLAPALVWPGASAQGHPPHSRPSALLGEWELGIHLFPAGQRRS